ncbi:hypothetical protein CA13_72320 [Planctomycetes bacterium CA13]|uniref:Uncharacterized protein n=1 Tax=Novipirellula herctigrandis TaxID=2527986 RepID=A0A5C5YPA1_9BACT|nr:hypothetical protein CA13_72320 [Planctomycetes bacterium CA13]
MAKWGIMSHLHDKCDIYSRCEQLTQMQAMHRANGRTTLGSLYATLTKLFNAPASF